jgi:aminoglycoside phosphotransferase (APT) family kinase protein
VPDLGPLLATGATADVHAWGDRRVVKLLKPGRPETWIAHEARIAEIIGGLDVPAPGFHGRVHVDGRPGLVYDRVDGRTMLEALRRRIWSTRSMAWELARLQSTVNSTVTDELPLVVDQLRNAIERAAALDEARRADILRLLTAAPGGDCLCHMDLHPDQVLIADGGNVVIDWTNAAVGDPHADVARTLLILSVGSRPGKGWRRTVDDRYRRTFRRIYLDAYANAAGFDPGRLRRWGPIVAAARLAEGYESERDQLVGMIDDLLR